MTLPSFVLEFPAATPQQTHEFMRAQLAFHTDVWDVFEDLQRGFAGIVVLDTRTAAQYASGHIPGAISLPHRSISADSTAGLDRGKTCVVYCDGIGCNASTKAAFRLSGLGFQVKELLGGLDFWIRDGYPLATGPQPGALSTTA
jgi:rhodanese-related sulfurtransferase